MRFSASIVLVGLMAGQSIAAPTSDTTALRSVEARQSTADLATAVGAALGASKGASSSGAGSAGAGASAKSARQEEGDFAGKSEDTFDAPAPIEYRSPQPGSAGASTGAFSGSSSSAPVPKAPAPISAPSGSSDSAGASAGVSASASVKVGRAAPEGTPCTGSVGGLTKKGSCNGTGRCGINVGNEFNQVASAACA